MKLLDFIHTTKAQAFLAILILVGGAIMVVFGHLSETSSNRIFDLMFLTATFYYGSSRSGAAKDEAISALAGNQVAQLPSAQ